MTKARQTGGHEGNDGHSCRLHLRKDNHSVVDRKDTALSMHRSRLARMGFAKHRKNAILLQLHLLLFARRRLKSLHMLSRHIHSPRDIHLSMTARASPKNSMEPLRDMSQRQDLALGQQRFRFRNSSRPLVAP